MVIQERRNTTTSSIICENGVLRLRIVSREASLGLALDALNDHGVWVPCLTTPAQGGLQFTDKEGHRQQAHYYNYDPVVVDGETRGLSLCGSLCGTAVTQLLILDRFGAWCRNQFAIDGDLPPARRLAHLWEIDPLFHHPEYAWPAAPRTKRKPVQTALLLQARTHFLAMVPDMDDCTNTYLALRLRAQQPTNLEYGQLTDEVGYAQCGYMLCLDARALPGRGYQQVVRRLGVSQTLSCMANGICDPADGILPPLPRAPVEAPEWVPFAREGNPGEIIAHTLSLLDLTEDWLAQEEALRWVDRLALQQVVHEVDAQRPLGQFDLGGMHDLVSCWAPVLLLRAFRITGIREYAARGATALGALPAHIRAQVHGYLYAEMGDLFIHLDAQETVVLQEVTDFTLTFTATGISLRVMPALPLEIVRVVMDGFEDEYSVIINGFDYGILPTEVLRNGLVVMSEQFE